MLVAACSWLQVLLRWGLEQGCAVIPKSVRPERVAEASEAALLSWQLPDQARRALDELAAKEGGQKYCWDPQDIA